MQQLKRGSQMNRIIVAGVSAGVGKSTFALKLGEKLQTPVHHLDSYYWKPGWTEASLEEFREAQKKLVQGECWIIEGNYSATMDIRLPRADTFIYLELPLWICVYRVLKRWIQNIGRTQSDLAEGCPEKMDKEFLKFIITTYSARKVKMRERMREFQQASPDNQVVFLASQKQIDGFLK